MAIKDVILGYAKGEKGDPGPRGEKGNTGATGPKGDPGNIADAKITDTEGLDVARRPRRRSCLMQSQTGLSPNWSQMMHSRKNLRTICLKA